MDNDKLISQIASIRALFINYGAASKALDMIETAYRQPATIRPRCCLILGAANNGKSYILTEFMQRYPGIDCVAAEAVDHPILYVSAPPQGQLRMLFTDMLTQLKVKYSNNMNTADLQNLVNQMIPACGVKLIIIDEFHSILVNTKIRTNTHNFIDHFRYLLNSWKIPVVCAGLAKDVEKVIDLDDQVKTRFNKQRLVLPAWNATSMETKRLLKSIGDWLPDEVKVDLNERRLRQAIVKHGQGRLGDMADVIIEAAIDSLISGSPITADQVNRLNGDVAAQEAA